MKREVDFMKFFDKNMCVHRHIKNYQSVSRKYIKWISEKIVSITTSITTPCSIRSTIRSHWSHFASGEGNTLLQNHFEAMYKVSEDAIPDLQRCMQMMNVISFSLKREMLWGRRSIQKALLRSGRKSNGKNIGQIFSISRNRENVLKTGNKLLKMEASMVYNFLSFNAT